MEHMVPSGYLALSDAVVLSLRNVYSDAAYSAAMAADLDEEAEKIWQARSHTERAKLFRALQMGDLFAELSRQGALSGRLSIGFWASSAGSDAMAIGEVEGGLRIVIPEAAFKSWLVDRKTLRPAPNVEDGHVVIDEYTLDAKDLRAHATQLGLTDEDLIFLEGEIASESRLVAAPPTPPAKRDGAPARVAAHFSKDSIKKPSETAIGRYNLAIDLEFNLTRREQSAAARRIAKIEGPGVDSDSVRRDITRVMEYRAKLGLPLKQKHENN